MKRKGRKKEKKKRRKSIDFAGFRNSLPPGNPRNKRHEVKAKANQNIQTKERREGSKSESKNENQKDSGRCRKAELGHDAVLGSGLRGRLCDWSRFRIPFLVSVDNQWTASGQ